jgi:antagonist of KipI
LNGGIDVPDVLGSQSTLLSANFGGLQGRPLQAKDVLDSGKVPATGWPTYRKAIAKLQGLYKSSAKKLRVTRGPQADWFTEESYRSFFAQEFEVTGEANRNGLRLRSNAVVLVRKKDFENKELVSEGVSWGSVQITGSAQPILLFCEQQTTGGYPKIATVVRADWGVLGQLRPGDRLHFEECSLSEAWNLYADLQTIIALGVEAF